MFSYLAKLGSVESVKLNKTCPNGTNTPPPPPRNNNPCDMDNNLVKYHLNPSYQWKVMTGNFGKCALWPWPSRYDLGLRSWHTLGLWTTIVWNIQIQHGSEELWPRHGFCVCVHCDLDLGDMTLGQGQDTPLGHGKHMCEILPRSNITVKS